MPTGLSFIDQLSPASFRGVPFWVQTDTEHGGRRLAIYEYPHGEEHDVEDLGKSAKHFRATAYVTGDDVLSRSAALRKASDAEGAGTLVLPEQGTMQARCQSFERNRSKDSHGYIAFEFAFVLESGQGASIPSADALAQAGFDAIGDLADIAAPLLGGAFSLVGQAASVLSDAADALTDIPATLETILSTSALDPTQVIGIGQSLAGTFADAAAVAGGSVVDPAILAGGFSAALALADAMSPTDGVAAFGNALDALV